MAAQATLRADTAPRVPVRSLEARHRPKILAHLLALGPEDRHLRFGYPASDAQIGQYVENIDFGQHEVFGIIDRRLDLVAMAHLAYAHAWFDSGTEPREAELGVSVDAAARGRGWGTRLFDRAVVSARNRGVDTLVILAAAANAPMLRIARSAGATVTFEGPDALARLELPPADVGSRVEALVEHQLAEFDYGCKLNACCIDIWLGLAPMAMHRQNPMQGFAPDARGPLARDYLQR
jgi:RimJ/RimL family protein N-acetyltransferase